MEMQAPFEVITPTLDGDVLAVLALADASFTVGQLSRMISASREGLRKVVRRLASQGIVTGEQHGPVTSYRLNRAHLAADPVIAIARLRSTFLARLEEAFASWPVAPTYAAVFGSAGRGAMTVLSDIDILVVRPEATSDPVWEEQVVSLSQSVTAWTGNDARFLEYSAEELDSERPEPVLLDVVAEGLTVYGSPSWLRKQMKRKGRGVIDGHS